MKPGQGLVGQMLAVLEVAADDLLLFRMDGKPRLAVPQQLLHLVVADPIVLVVVQHWNQHVQVGEKWCRVSCATARP